MAVFDNDGTLWCEKPMPVELGLILQRLSPRSRSAESNDAGPGVGRDPLAQEPSSRG